MLSRMKKAVLVAGVFLVAGAVGFWLFGRPAYRRFKEDRAVARAKAFLTSDDYRNANLSARQALAVNPRNLEACQVMAQLAEMARAPQVLDWRRRVADISPTVDNRLRFVATALMVEQPPWPLATQALDELARTATNSAAYHVVAAELALKLNHVTEAEAQFLAAGRLQPTNPLHQLNLAVVRLRSTNEADYAEARATLDRLAGNPNLSHIALQWLVNDDLARKDFAAALQFSDRLLAGPQTTLDDLLQHLTILRASGRPEFDAFLNSIQSQAVTNPVAVQAVADWMVNHELAGSARQWLTNCPRKLQAEQPVPLALIDCYRALKDWVGLEAWLTDQKWGEMEFVRLAALSRAEEQLHRDTVADAHWRLAVRAAGDRIGALSSLLAMSVAWDRDKARENLLWQIYDGLPRERWAGKELERLYAAAGNTRGLNKLYAAMVARDANDILARNNFAATAMLLQTSLPKAHQTSREVYAARPDEPIVVSTYAWSLHLQGRTKDALAAMEKLRPDELQRPAIALYYGLLLAADKQSDKAARYLALGKRPGLLPEEREFLAAAEKGQMRK
jgi:predicted Zn-dependent protease